jgi:hypothetical protein
VFLRLTSFLPPCIVQFNICGFGSDFQYLFPKSVQYNKDSKTKALAHINTLNADLGGTNLSKPLQDILARESLPDFPRSVFVLTDGQVDDRNQTIGIVAREAPRHHTRVFAIGIGSGADRSLVEGIASAGSGDAGELYLYHLLTLCCLLLLLLITFQT